MAKSMSIPHPTTVGVQHVSLLRAHRGKTRATHASVEHSFDLPAEVDRSHINICMIGIETETGIESETGDPSRLRENMNSANKMWSRTPSSISSFPCCCPCTSHSAVCVPLIPQAKIMNHTVPSEMRQPFVSVYVASRHAAQRMLAELG